MVDSNSQQPASATPTSVDVLATRFLSRVFRQGDEPSRPKHRKAGDLPWETWELDEEFFRTLSRWTLSNPETSLDRVLDKIRDRFESSQDAFQLIPDSPFPARSLVTALAHLLKLGSTIHRAQKDVQEFAKDVIRWVGLVKFAFESAENGRFTHRAWRDLKHMRELVDKICLWAVDRLDDGRWSRIGHGLMIQKEIKEFNERITNARALFQDMSTISMARGLDAILESVRDILLRQQNIMNEIKKVRKTQKKQLDRIVDELEMKKEIAERERFFAKTLNVRAVANPTYDSQGRRPCDEDTRTEVLDQIRKWANDIAPGSKNFLWLTGAPGCGKSAVTASFARDCKDRGVLWAQFFINRNNAETTDPRSYFPSIARQLADYSPEVAKAIHHTLAKQRSLIDDISADQAVHLLVNSIQKASELDPDRPIVIVIDGLDETDRERLEDTAKIFSTLFAALKAHSNVKVFISSRTEDEIRNSFARKTYDKYVKQVHLDTAHPSSIADVSRYIMRGLMKIVEKHNLNWDVWPGDKRSRILGDRASGLFIWAVTAIKFIQQQLQSDGEECLDDVLDLLTADVLYDINALYMLILKISHGRHQSEWESERFRRVVGAIVFLQEPLCIDDLAALLDLRKTPSSKPVDIAHFVRRFRTILVTGTDVIDGKTIPRIHKSVFEFFTSSSVDARFRVDPSHAHLELGLQCLTHLGTVAESFTEDTLSMPLRYAFRFWFSHLSQAKVLGSTSICVDRRQSQSKPLSLQSLNQRFSSEKPSIIQYHFTLSQIKATVGEDEKVWDAISGHNIFHTDLVRCIIFSPDSKQIVTCSRDKTIRVWSSSNGEWIRTLAKHSSSLYAIAFSPDGKTIVSASHDRLLCLWDYSTGAQIMEPFRGHRARVTCVAFSPDGRKIISGSDDTTCILWNVRNRRPVKDPWIAHKYSVTFVTFSASGQRVCSRDSSGSCIIWDATAEQRIIATWKYDGNTAFGSFSPKNDDFTAMGGFHYSRSIEIRRNERRWTIPDSKDVRCLSFSPDGKEIYFATDETISVAQIGKDESATRVIGRGNYRHPEYAYSSRFAFSPNMKYFAHADRKRVHVYTLNRQHNKTFIDVAPVNELITASVKHDGGREVVLSNMKESRRRNSVIRNRRLDAIKWYKGEANVQGRSNVKLCVVEDDVVIVGHDDGSVSVWSHTS